MAETAFVFLSAFWLGLLTSISPCPLATNIAAVSFLSKKITRPQIVFLTGLSYTMGRMLAYAVLGFLIIYSLLSVPVVAQFLQKYMNQVLGPVLIVVGFFLMDALKFNIPGLALSQEHRDRLAGSGIGGAFLLGFIFAMSFCPISAALFFGSLIPLTLQYRFGGVLPFVYGFGTGLPVFAFALAIALGVTSLSHWFNRLTRLEYYARRATGIVFILVGLYYTGIYLLRFP